MNSEHPFPDTLFKQVHPLQVVRMEQVKKLGGITKSRTSVTLL